MDAAERIVSVAREEFPGSKVVFDGDSAPMIRFRIEDGAGCILSKGFPGYTSAQVSNWSEQELRAIVRGICGF